MNNLLLCKFDVIHEGTCGDSCDCLDSCPVGREIEREVSFMDVFQLIASCDGVESWVATITELSTGKNISPKRIVDIAEGMVKQARKSCF